MTVYILEGFLLLSIPIIFYFYTMRMSSNRNPDRAEIRAMRSGLKPGFDDMDKIIIENGVILTVSKLRRCGLSEWKVYISLDNAGDDELYIEEIKVSSHYQSDGSASTLTQKLHILLKVSDVSIFSCKVQGVRMRRPDVSVGVRMSARLYDYKSSITTE